MLEKGVSRHRATDQGKPENGQEPQRIFSVAVHRLMPHAPPPCVLDEPSRLPAWFPPAIPPARRDGRPAPSDGGALESDGPGEGRPVEPGVPGRPVEPGVPGEGRPAEPGFPGEGRLAEPGFLEKVASPNLASPEKVALPNPAPPEKIAAPNPPREDAEPRRPLEKIAPRRTRRPLEEKVALAEPAGRVSPEKINKLRRRSRRPGEGRLERWCTLEKSRGRTLASLE